ncbi:MAG TPA: site-specific integrase [Tepidisphaeraceae bacterium]|jgi:integrase|nr:site-specific integrase [Tepidisphaeraceae bacterium]
MASVIKVGKKWYVKLYDANGKQRKVKGYTEKSETMKLAARLENEKTAIQRGDLDPQLEMKKTERAKAVVTHIEEYKTFLRAKGNSTNHVSYTIRDIKQFITFSGVKHAAEITRAAVDRWRMNLMEQGTDSRRTINRRVGSLQAFLRQLQQTGGVTDYVLHKYPKLKVAGHAKRKRRSLAPAETTKLIAQCQDPERKDVYRVALLTGLRHNEIVRLTPAAIDLDRGTITVHAKDPRHKDRIDVIPLHTRLISMMKDRTKEKGKDQPMFDVPRRGIAAKLLRADCVAAGVDTSDVDFHALRHTFVTRLAETNVHPKIAQVLARHANVETTLSFYTHFHTDDERKALSSLPSVG